MKQCPCTLYEAGDRAGPCEVRGHPQYFQEGFWELLQTVTNFETYPFLQKILYS